MSMMRVQRAAGLHDPKPDADLWAKWKDSLTYQERAVYLCLRWLVTQEGFSGRLTHKQLAAAVGDPAHMKDWGSRGRMPQSAVIEAIEGLADKGLLEVQETED